MALTSCSLGLVVLVVVLIYNRSHGQSIAVDEENAFDALEPLGCGQFKAMISGAGLERKYSSNRGMTLFVFNDTTYNLYGRILNFDTGATTEQSLINKADYVEAFTLSKALETTQFSPSAPEPSIGLLSLSLFLNKAKLRVGNVASGQPGPTKFFCNGAMIVRPNIKAGQYVIHMIDRVLPMPKKVGVLAYLSGRAPDKPKISLFYTQIMQYLDRSMTHDDVFNYEDQVKGPLSDPQVTFFLPSDEAVRNIPDTKLDQLRSNDRLMLEIITLHIIPKSAVYTSIVNHNQLYNTQMNSGTIVFRKNFLKEAVYVTGSLRSGDTVTAGLITSNSNVTWKNGVVHQIDRVLGFIYKTALEEIRTEQTARNFEAFINAARTDIKSAVSQPKGVTIFCPVNSAIQAIGNVDANYINDMALINRVVELSLLEPGVELRLTQTPGGYRSPLEQTSRYNRRIIKIYSAGNDTWVEGGYVKAKIIKPDVGVSNGLVHYIDAVFGVPTRDIVQTIFCEDRLETTYQQLMYVGLDKYMRDPLLIRNQECSHRSGVAAGGVGIPNTGSTNTQNGYDRELCRRGSYKCEFTFFVPNGTAIENFRNNRYTQNILNDKDRWRWILRRHMTTRETIYIDRLAIGAERSYRADNGEEVRIRSSRSGSGPANVYITFGDVDAQVIHSDIGATNGVIHIVNMVLTTSDDPYRDISGSTAGHMPITTIVLFLIISLVSLEFL